MAPDDAEAGRLLDQANSDRLVKLQARAEKWLAGLAAMTATLTTVLVIDGPDDYADLSPPIQLVVGSLLVLSLAAAVIGLIFGYSAAYGSPLDSKAILGSLAGPYAGAADRWETANERFFQRSMRNMRLATISAAVTVLAMAGVVAATWADSTTRTSHAGACMQTVDGGIVRISEIPEVLNGRISMIRCPTSS